MNNTFIATQADLCVYCPRNSNTGLGHTNKGYIINNFFDKGVAGHANNSNLQDPKQVYINNNLLLSGSISYSAATVGQDNHTYGG